MKGYSIEIIPIVTRDRVADTLIATGEVPSFIETLQSRNVQVDGNWFRI